MQINLAGAFYKRPDRTPEQCQRHYVENHGPLIRDTDDSSRDVTSYTQHKRLFLARFDACDADVCGVSQLLYRDIDAVRACFAGAAYSDVVRPDEERLADLSRAIVAIGPVDTIVHGGDASYFRLFRFVREGQGGRRRIHGEAIARELAGLVRGFRQTFSLRGGDNPFSGAPLFDGVDEFRFDTLPQIGAFLVEEGKLPDRPAAAASLSLVGGFRRFI